MNPILVPEFPGSKAFVLVRECDVRWNQIESSMVLMYEKLVKLEFECGNDQVMTACQSSRSIKS